MTAAASRAASILGRLGGSARSDAKTASSRANGSLGGRPVKLRTIAGITVHADCERAGTIEAGWHKGKPAFKALTPAASRWLRRHGFVRSGKRWFCP